jgi:hypothetical protein
VWGRAVCGNVHGTHLVTRNRLCVPLRFDVTQVFQLGFLPVKPASP